MENAKNFKETPYGSQKEKSGKKGQTGQESVEAQTQRSLHETDEHLGPAGQCRRRQAHSAHRGHQETVGLHQEERPPGQEEQAHDQGRRRAQGRVRRQGDGQHVRDDQAGEQAPQVTHSIMADG